MPGLWKILYKYKASLSIPGNLRATITCSNKKILNFTFVQSWCISLHYELRNNQLKIPIYQPDVKQDNSCFHSRDSCHRFVSDPVHSFAICPDDPSLLPLSSRHCWNCPFSSCKDWPCLSWWRWEKEDFDREKNYRVRGNKATAIGLVQVRDKVTVSSLRSATKAGLLRRRFTATRLTGRNWNYGLILPHGHNYRVPFSIRHFSPLLLRCL